MSQKDKHIDKNAGAAVDADDAAKLPPSSGYEEGDAHESTGRGPGGGGDSSDPDGDTDGMELYGLLAEYRSPGELIAAAEKVRDAGYTQWDCYSPFPVHGIDPAMGIKRTILPVIVFVIGLGGLCGGLLLQWWTNAHFWPWLVGGKPIFSLPANIPITFETTVLASVFATFFGMWGLNKLPQVWHPFFKKDRFLRVTDDSFFIGIEASDPKFQRGKTEALLKDAGALVVETCYTSADPRRRDLPKPVFAFILVTTVMALAPVALIGKARVEKTREPRIHLIPDMDFQPKVKTQAVMPLFFDDRGTRGQIQGTIARGDYVDNEHLFHGIVNGQWAQTFPPELVLDETTMARGKKNFEIYCQPCHGASGDGNGMIQARVAKIQAMATPGDVPVQGWNAPTSLHQEYVVKMPHGQIFNTITNGIRSMRGYATQITDEADRWAIVLYVRALQRSQAAAISDVPDQAQAQFR